MPVTYLPFIQQQMVRYGMTTYLVLGLLGNTCNCIIFTHRSHRRIPSSIYFLSLSIFSIFYLIWSAVPLIYTLNHTDPQTQSILYCKLRSYISHVLGQIDRYIIVCACADRFFATQTNVRIRSLSSVRVAIKLIIIICLGWLLVSIHLPILTDIRGGVCGVPALHRFVYGIYQIIFVGIVPPVLMSVFSLITIHSLHQRHGAQRQARQRDRYLMRMLIAEVIVYISTSIPFSINLLYAGVTFYAVDKSAQQLEIEGFVMFVTQFLIYFMAVTPFYLFLLTSKPFRNGFIKIVVSCWRKCMVRQVRIVPLNNQHNTTTNNGRVTGKRQ